MPDTIPQPSQKPILVYDRIDKNRRNTIILLGVFGIILSPVVYWITLYFIFLAGFFIPPLSALVQNRPVSALLIATPIVLPIILLFLYRSFLSASDRVVRMAGALPVPPDQEEEFRRIVENLCIGAGLPLPRLYIVESLAPNAFAAGLDPANALLIVTRGLLKLLDRRELEGVVAHELSHIGNYDTRLRTIMAAMGSLLRLPLAIMVKLVQEKKTVLGFSLMFAWFIIPLIILLFSFVLGLVDAEQLLKILLIISTIFLTFYPGGWGVLQLLLADLPDTGRLIIFSIPMLLYIFFAAPALSALIRLALSRQREFLADSDAALLTRYPSGLAVALVKIEAAIGLSTKVNPAMIHLYIIDPLSDRHLFSNKIFSTHPSIKERIAILSKMGTGIEPSVLRAAETAGSKFRDSYLETTHTEPDKTIVAVAVCIFFILVSLGMGGIAAILLIYFVVYYGYLPERRSENLRRKNKFLVLEPLKELSGHFEKGPQSQTITDVAVVAEKGQAAIDVILHSFEGITVTLSKLRGKIVILHFWATWSEQCQKEMSSLEELYKKFTGSELIILAVSVDKNAETVKEFVKKNNYTLPVLHDTLKKARRGYGVSGIPETFLIDKNGVIVERFIGSVDWMYPEVIQRIEELLKRNRALP